MAYITYIMFPILSCLQLAWTHSSPWLLTALNGPWVLGFFWSAFFTGPAWWPTFTLVAGATYHLLQALSWWTPGINAGYWFTVFFNMTSPLGTGANILWLFWVRLGNALGAQTSFWILFYFWWLYTIIGFWFFAMAPFVLVTLFCTWSPAAIIYTLLMVFWLISEGVLTTLIAFFVDVAIEGAGRGRLAEPVVVIAVIHQLVWGVRRTLLQIVAFGRVLPFWRLTQPTVERWSLDLIHTLAWPLRCIPSWQILSRLIRGDWPDEPLPGRVRFVALLVYRIGDIAATCREDGPVMSWYRYMPNWTWTPFGVVLGFFVHGTNLPWSDEMRAYARTSVRTTGWRILIFFGALVLPEIVFWIWLLFQLTVAGVLLFLGQGMGYAVLSSVFKVAFFGHATFGENVVRWLADFPTVFSPRVVGNVWTDWLINRYPHLFTWVGALHIRANRLGPAVGEAKVRELISRTPYSFIRASGAFTHCPGPEVVKTSTLLLRHWIYMAWHLAFARRPAPSILSLVSGLDKVFINAQYALLGVQETAVVEVEVDLAAHLLVALLSQLEWDIFEADVHSITVPAPSRLISYMYNNLVRSVSPLGAVDLQPLVARVQALRPGDAFIFSAPTGVGKSTRLMVVTQEAVNMRVVVILPRRLLVLQITEYMRRAFPGHTFGAGTEDGFVPRDWDILYCTAQYALVADLPERCIFVVDECHVAEPAHNTIMRQCLRLRRPTIFVSATPPDWLGQVVHSVLALPANPRFKVQTVEKQADSYRAYLNEAGTFVSLARPRTRILVFTKFVADAVAFASNCGRPACVLSSKHTTLDVKAEVFVSTSVSDAGLTIPDVEYVLSCDQDFTLGTNSAFDEEEVRTMNVSGKHFTLSERVLTQRRGRTGRTSDGIFVLWKLREVLRPAELSPEDYISSLGSLIPRVYVDLPAHVQRILPTQQEMTTAGPLWITELAPWIPPDTVNPEDDTNEEAHAKIMASMLSQARIFDPTGGQEYSYLTPEEIAPVDGEGFPVLIPRGARIEVWYMGLEAHAEALFTERTGGDTLERQLLEFMRSADISGGALTVLLRDAGVHTLSFASMLWIMPRTGAIWKMLHPHLAGPTVPPVIKRFMDRYIAANIQQRVVGRLTEVAIPAPPPVSVTPDLAQFISHLGINRGIGTMTVLTTASAINISYLQCILFLQGTEDAIKLLQMPAAARPPNMNRLLIRLYQQWRR